MIPIDKAKIHSGYQCPWSHELFSTKRSYVKHLKNLRTTRMHRRARQLRWGRLGEELWNQTSFEKIVHWVELHPEWFLDNLKQRCWNHDRKFYERIHSDFSVRITYLDLYWSDSVSNAHSCPHNGETNWGGRKPNVPRGYHGWTGRIEYQLSHDIPSFGSDVMEGSRIHTGTGGGINENRYGFSVSFFADDWPGLQKNQTWEILKGTDMNHILIGNPIYFRH